MGLQKDECGAVAISSLDFPLSCGVSISTPTNVACPSAKSRQRVADLCQRQPVVMAVTNDASQPLILNGMLRFTLHHLCKSPAYTVPTSIEVVGRGTVSSVYGNPCMYFEGVISIRRGASIVIIYVY
jgi:hypothetical protein